MSTPISKAAEMVEVVTEVQRRRWAGQEKVRLVEETFKRDCVHVHDRPDARTVLAQPPAWIEGCNVHPRKGLRVKSFRRFIRESRTAACPV